MPRALDKPSALARIAAERVGAGPCLICALGSGRLPAGPTLAVDEHTRVQLTRYPVRWGHVLVLSNQHVTSFSELSADHWREMSEQARSAAVAVERALSPARCYVASLGASDADVLITSPHLHLHVVPVYDPDDRPSRVLTWEHGVLEADPSEWHALAESLRAAWPGE